MSKLNANKLVTFRLSEACEVAGKQRSAGEVVSVSLRDAARLDFLTRAKPVDDADIPLVRDAFRENLQRCNGRVGGVPARSRAIFNPKL